HSHSSSAAVFASAGVLFLLASFGCGGGGGGHSSFHASTGTLDTSFAATGSTTLDFGYTDQANAVALQSDGKIVVAGSDDGGAPDCAAIRLDTSGTLDATFGTGGSFTQTFGGIDKANAIAIQSDGKIVLAGSTSVGNNFAVLRLTTAG